MLFLTGAEVGLSTLHSRDRMRMADRTAAFRISIRQIDPRRKSRRVRPPMPVRRVKAPTTAKERMIGRRCCRGEGIGAVGASRLSCAYRRGPGGCRPWGFTAAEEKEAKREPGGTARSSHQGEREAEGVDLRPRNPAAFARTQQIFEMSGAAVAAPTPEVNIYRAFITAPAAHSQRLESRSAARESPRTRFL
jgi:hypothetical protein